MTFQDTLLTEKEVARLLGVSTYLLQRWRCYGGGPNYIRVGGRGGRAIRYRRSDITAYLEKNTVTPERGGAQ